MGSIFRSMDDDGDGKADHAEYADDADTVDGKHDGEIAADTLDGKHDGEVDAASLAGDPAPLGNSSLANSSITLNGYTVDLGGSLGSMDYVDLVNHEHGDYDTDGRLYWDLSAGLYIKSGNAAGSQTGGRLLWSGANVGAGSNVGISYNSEDEPTLSVSPQGSGSGLDADTVDGQHASDLGASGNYSDETANRAAGTEYQNTTGGPLEVRVISNGQYISSGALTMAEAQLNMGSSSGSLSTVAHEQNVTDGDYASNMTATASMTVPDGWYYSLSSTQGTSLSKWMETEL